MASLGSIGSITSLRYPHCLAALKILCIDLPTKEICLPVLWAQKKIDSILATFDAKHVTIILFFNLSNILSKFFLTSISEPDLPILNTFVESHIIAKTPSSPIDFSFLESITSPINGFGSHFQSPVCNTQPSGVLIFSPLGSRME